MAGLLLVASWGVWDWKRAACRFRVSGEVPRAYLGKKTLLVSTGAERISSEVELVSVEQKEENIQCKKRESGSSVSLFHSVRMRRFRHFSSWQPDEAVLW